MAPGYSVRRARGCTPDDIFGGRAAGPPPFLCAKARIPFLIVSRRECAKSVVKRRSALGFPPVTIVGARADGRRSVEGVRELPRGEPVSRPRIRASPCASRPAKSKLHGREYRDERSSRLPRARPSSSDSVPISLGDESFPERGDVARSITRRPISNDDQSTTSAPSLRRFPLSVCSSTPFFSLSIRAIFRAERERTASTMPTAFVP